MSQGPIQDDSDDDLRAADELLGKADALLRRRHRQSDAPAPDPLMSLDEDDLPLLTDIVDPSELPEGLASASTVQPTSVGDERPDGIAQPSPARPPAEHADAPPREPRPRPADLDTALRDAMENWFATEFPQLLSRELDAFSARLQQEILAQLRAALSQRRGGHDDEAEAAR